MKYIILAGHSEDLTQLVNGYLTEGWTLFGQPFKDNGTIYQAMTLGGEPVQGEMLSAPLEPVTHTHTISLDVTDMKKTLGDFLNKFTEAASGETKKGPSKDKG